MTNDDAEFGAPRAAHDGGEIVAVGGAAREDDEEALHDGEDGEEDGDTVGEPELVGGVDVDVSIDDCCDVCVRRVGLGDVRAGQVSDGRGESDGFESQSLP